jgi:hypothetical protein
MRVGNGDGDVLAEGCGDAVGDGCGFCAIRPIATPTNENTIIANIGNVFEIGNEDIAE